MGRSLKPAPAIEVAEVESLDQEGRGVAHAGGKAVFIDGALPGETVSFQRTRRQRRYDEASVVEVLRASPDRVRPRCRHYGVCGGCSLQHLDHAAQLAAKGRVVAEALERIGGVTPDAWLPPLTGPIWSYRRRARVGSKFVDKKGKVLVGFRERGSPLLADLEVCEVLASPAGNLITPLAELIGGTRHQAPRGADRGCRCREHDGTRAACAGRPDTCRPRTDARFRNATRPRALPATRGSRHRRCR